MIVKQKKTKRSPSHGLTRVYNRSTFERSHSRNEHIGAHYVHGVSSRTRSGHGEDYVTPVKSLFTRVSEFERDARTTNISIRCTTQHYVYRSLWVHIIIIIIVLTDVTVVPHKVLHGKLHVELLHERCGSDGERTTIRFRSGVGTRVSRSRLRSIFHRQRRRQQYNKYDNAVVTIIEVEVAPLRPPREGRSRAHASDPSRPRSSPVRRRRRRWSGRRPTFAGRIRAALRATVGRKSHPVQSRVGGGGVGVG